MACPVVAVGHGQPVSAGAPRTCGGAVTPRQGASGWPYVGTPGEGARLELLEPVGSGFLARFLFGDVLGGRLREGRRCLEVSWPNGTLRVQAADRPGVTGMDLRGARGVRIGSAGLGMRD